MIKAQWFFGQVLILALLLMSSQAADIEHYSDTGLQAGLTSEIVTDDFTSLPLESAVNLTVNQVVKDTSASMIPENLSEWTEKGTVLSTDPAISWEEQNQIAVAGVAKIDSTYYLFYLAGFDGCWNADGDCNHQSLGLATSSDGIHFTKYYGNPVLKPHDFLPVESEEEGIRTGYVRYLPSKNKFYGYFGVESPGGSGSCPFGGGSGCGCNIGVDAAVFLATSSNGTNWTIEGQVSGTNATSGHEVYASGWVFDGTTFYLYINTAEGGYSKSASTGTDPLNLTYLGGVSALDFGWAGVDTFLHDDNNTVTLMYEPSGGSHPGCSNDNLYFATTHLDDLRNIENERVITNSGHERNIIFKDGTEWKWYYSDEADEYNNAIKLRTHPITTSDTIPPTLSNPFPTGELSSGTTEVTLSLTTDENAACRYSTTAGVSYSSMPNTFAITGTTSHSTTVSGLSDGNSYTYYVRCQDTADNANPDDYPITFSIAESVESLVLHGSPADQSIHLNWTVSATLPVTSTWQLAYAGPAGDQSSPITGIISPTRAYTLTSLTNYTFYTVTLNAMLDSTPFLTDTVTVLPTDIFVYLPLILKGS